MTCKNMAEKADYPHISGSNINIYSKNKGLCLGAGVLTIVCVGGRDFFFQRDLGRVVKFLYIT